MTSRTGGSGVINARPWPKIDKQTKKMLRQWARDNWQAGKEVKDDWHPVVQYTWRQLDRRNKDER